MDFIYEFAVGGNWAPAKFDENGVNGERGVGGGHGLKTWNNSLSVCDEKLANTAGGDPNIKPLPKGDTHYWILVILLSNGLNLLVSHVQLK